ncbi:protein of unknown function [Citrobacter amalonaticus]|nr:protein of unknown function [Citrobacter amalonaticus]
MNCIRHAPADEPDIRSAEMGKIGPVLTASVANVLYKL